MVPAHVDPQRPYHHPDYDRFWASLQEIGAPLTMHIFTGTDWLTGLAEHWGAPGSTIKGYTFAHTSVANTVIDLICGGVFERYPDLRVVVSEFETGWVSHFLRRLDHAIYRTPKDAVDYLTMKPSDYFHRNVSITFEDDPDGIATRHSIGVSNLLLGERLPPPRLDLAELDDDPAEDHGRRPRRRGRADVLLERRRALQRRRLQAAGLTSDLSSAGALTGGAPRLGHDSAVLSARDERHRRIRRHVPGHR